MHLGTARTVRVLFERADAEIEVRPGRTHYTRGLFIELRLVTEFRTHKDGPLLIALGPARMVSLS